MKRYIFLSFLLAFFIFGCECEDITPTVIVELPDPFLASVSEESIDDGELFLMLSFSDPVDTSTVRIGESVLFTGLDTLFLDRSSSLFFLSFRGKVTGCPPTNNPPCAGRFTITLNGTGSSVIKSIDGQVLDGEPDGSDGGDFVYSN